MQSAIPTTVLASWLQDHLPAPLLSAGPLDVLWWQWIALLLALPLAALVGWLLAPPTQAVMKRAVAKTPTPFDDEVVAAARGPLVLFWGVAASRVFLWWIELPEPVESALYALQRAALVVAVFWIVFRAIKAMQDALPVSAWASRHPALRSVIPLLGRIARVLVFVLGVLAVLATFGYPVATILAGLGIGGIAIALGAQKSLEHFFGSVSIGVDQPFRVGDAIAVDGIEGDVEAIGLRSTRIRTIDRTVVSIPNGRLAESRTENFGLRERMRFRTVVRLEYGTPSATIRAVRDATEALLRAHPKTWTGQVVVHLVGFGESALELEVFCWVETPTYAEFRAIREEFLLGIMEVVERAGAKFAYPTRTVNLRQM
jgi:MscS family membrane protein